MKKRLKKVKQAAVIIDGAYLSRISKYFGHGKYLKYNIQTLAINLCRKRGYWCEDIFYHTAPPYQSEKPTSEQIKLKSSYDKFISKIQRGLPTTWVREGRLQKTSDGFKQKGVDSNINTDLLKIAQRREHDAIIIITADSDFAPTISSIRKDYGTFVIIAYFTDLIRNSPFAMSNYLWQACDDKILINKTDFFINNKK